MALERRPADGEEAKLIVKDAEAYILQPVRSRVPIIMGITSCEYDQYGTLFYSKLADMLQCRISRKRLASLSWRSARNKVLRLDQHVPLRAMRRRAPHL